MNCTVACFSILSSILFIVSILYVRPIVLNVFVIAVYNYPNNHNSFLIYLRDSLRAQRPIANLAREKKKRNTHKVQKQDNLCNNNNDDDDDNNNNNNNMCSYPTRATNICVHSVFVLSCVGIGFAAGWSPPKVSYWLSVSLGNCKTDTKFYHGL
jgi:hypothetical protein